jgi:hypothetical protein
MKSAISGIKRYVDRWKSTGVSEEYIASIFRVEEQVLFATCFHADFLLGLFFDPENWGGMFLRNVGWL